MSFRLVVSGYRKFSDYNFLCRVLDKLTERQSDIILIHGGAKGADTLAGEWAKERGIPVEVFPADWTLGKQAGMIRNRRMIDAGCDGLVAFIAKESIGTRHCVEYAKSKGVQIVAYHVVLDDGVVTISTQIQYNR